jgi:radical SAM protein with 4Fe4S-binding SPASM domain
VNTTVTRQNLAELAGIHALAERLSASAHHIFLLVPTGRGKYISEDGISPEEYEQTLNWFYDRREKTAMQLKATCAPHYYRILRQRAALEGKTVTFKTHGLDAVSRGCLAGTGFCFVSHTGTVQPCGFLDLSCGNVTKTPFDRIWRESGVFLSLRDHDRLTGKCGRCEYRRVCGGCRARAYESTGDYLAEEPLCVFAPAS